MCTGLAIGIFVVGCLMVLAPVGVCMYLAHREMPDPPGV